MVVISVVSWTPPGNPESIFQQFLQTSIVCCAASDSHQEDSSCYCGIWENRQLNLPPLLPPPVLGNLTKRLLTQTNWMPDSSQIMPSWVLFYSDPFWTLDLFSGAFERMRLKMTKIFNISVSVRSSTLPFRFFSVIEQLGHYTVTQ